MFISSVMLQVRELLPDSTVGDITGYRATQDTAGGAPVCWVFTQVQTNSLLIINEATVTATVDTFSGRLCKSVVCFS